MTPWTAAHQASLSVTNSWNLLKLMSIESVMTSSHLILCHLLLLPSSVFPSIRVFSNESGLRFRWPKYWSFSFSISPSNEYSGLICFRIYWFDLLAVQGTLKSLLQHHSSSVRGCDKSRQPPSGGSAGWLVGALGRTFLKRAAPKLSGLCFTSRTVTMGANQDPGGPRHSDLI